MQTKTEQTYTQVTAPVIESEPPFDGVLTPDMRLDPSVREWMEVFVR